VLVGGNGDTVGSNSYIYELLESGVGVEMDGSNDFCSQLDTHTELHTQADRAAQYGATNHQHKIRIQNTPTLSGFSLSNDVLPVTETNKRQSKTNNSPPNAHKHDPQRLYQP
jgi:hypothetical protein